MAVQKRKKRKTATKKRKSNALVVWTIIIVSLLVIGYFSYPRLKPWFVERVNSKEVDLKDQSQTKAPNDLTANVWVNELDGSMLGFNNNGSYSIDFPSVEQTRQITGTYTIQNNTLRLRYDPEISMCSNKEGAYHFTVEDDHLTFDDVNDPCSERKDLLLAGWFRL